MAKIAKKLTDTEIKSTKPADKEINLFDGDGLILRIALTCSPLINTPRC